MGNCFPNLKKKKKNKVSSGTTSPGSDLTASEVSEILSRSSSGGFLYSSCSSSSEELEMAKAFDTPDEDRDVDDMYTEDAVVEIRKPVFFQIDYVQGMPHRMPSRLAERMDQKPSVGKPIQQMTLTEEDERLMDEILAEAEANERLEQLIEQQIAAQNLRELRLNAVREKARSMRMRPSTRARRDGDGGNGSGGSGGGGGGGNGDGGNGANGDRGNGEGSAGGNGGESSRGGANRDAGRGEGN